MNASAAALNGMWVKHDPKCRFFLNNIFKQPDQLQPPTVSRRSLKNNEPTELDLDLMLNELDRQIIEQNTSMRRVLCLSFIVGMNVLNKSVQGANDLEKFRTVATKNMDIDKEQTSLEKLEKKNGELEKANAILTKNNNELMADLTNLQQFFKANELALEQTKLNYGINSNKLKKDCEEKLIIMKFFVQWLLKSEYQKKLIEKEKLLTQQREQINQLKLDHEKKLKEACQEKENAINEKQEEIDLNLQLIEAQINKIAEQENANLELKTKNQEFERERQNIKGELKTKENEYIALLKQIRKMLVEIKLLKQEFDKWKPLIKVFIDNIQAMEKQFKAKETEKNNVVRQLKDLQKQKAQFELEKKQLHKEIETQKKHFQIIAGLFFFSWITKDNEINALKDQVKALTAEKQAVEKEQLQLTDQPPKNLDKPQSDHYINAFLFASLAFGGLLYKHHGSILYYLNHFAVKLSEEFGQGLYNLVDI